jgi:hypothetical protein
MNEWQSNLTKRFNPELAENLSKVVHDASSDSCHCRHDIGILLAQEVYAFYSKELNSKEITK